MNAANPTFEIPREGGASLPVEEEIETTRLRALQLANADQIQFLDTDALVEVQSLLRHGPEFGKWVTPHKWHVIARKNHRNVDLMSRMLDLMPDQSTRELIATPQGQHLLKHAVQLFTRYLIVLRIAPASMGRSTPSPINPRYVAAQAYFGTPSLFAIALCKWANSGNITEALTPGHFLGIVVVEDVKKQSLPIQEHVMREARRMRLLVDRGYWSDLPKIEPEQAVVTDVSGSPLPFPVDRVKNPHLPLPDDYVSEMGRKSLWIIESLGPTLLKITEKIALILSEIDQFGLPPEKAQNRKRYAVEKALLSWEWTDDQGQPLGSPPFQIRLSHMGTKRKASRVTQWPPKKITQIMGLLSNLQSAHMFVVLLATGARTSEALSLRRDCIEYARDGQPYANGRTYKLVDRYDGLVRDWTLPDLAVNALEQQCRLVRLVENIEIFKFIPATIDTKNIDVPADHLWTQVSAGPLSNHKLPTQDLGVSLRAYANALGMNPKPNNQWLRPHRFRKTIARLAALALTHAPKILMDVFGHKAIEMTLYYILCDKDLQTEIETVSRELRIMRAETAINAIVEAENVGKEMAAVGNYGGPAALILQQAVDRKQEQLRSGGNQWGADSVRDLAEILTLQGKAWEAVRQGVICTKLPGTEAGPCNKSRGRPEPSKCQSDCRHRLEEGFLREDINNSIAMSVTEYEDATKAQDELMQAMWAGQIRAHIERLSELKAKWKDHPIVQQVLAI